MQQAQSISSKINNNNKKNNTTKTQQYRQRKSCSQSEKGIYCTKNSQVLRHVSHQKLFNPEENGMKNLKCWEWARTH